MPNSGNYLGQQLFGALGNIVSSYLVNKGEQEKKKKSKETYFTILDNINRLLGKDVTQQIDPMQINTGQETNVIDPMAEFYGTFDPNAPVEQNVRNMQPIKPELEGLDIKPRVSSPKPPSRGDLKGDGSAPLTTKPGDYKNAVDAFYGGIVDLMDQGEYGAQYVPLVQSYYEQKRPKEPKLTTQTAGDYLVTFDTKGNIVKKERIKDEKQKKNTLGEYSQMTFDDASKLPVDELENSFLYFNKDVQDKLKQTYPVLQQLSDRTFKEGDFMPKIGGPKFGAPKTNFLDTQSKDIGQKLFMIKRQIASTGWENADYKLQEEYNSLRNQLSGMGISDPDTWAETIGQGGKLQDAKEYQQQFAGDYNTIVFSKGSIYDQLINMYNIDTSKSGGPESLQVQANALYDWLGNNIYGKVDPQIEQAIYDYVNTEISKLWKSKGL